MKTLLCGNYFFALLLCSVSLLYTAPRPSLLPATLHLGHKVTVHYQTKQCTTVYNIIPLRLYWDKLYDGLPEEWLLHAWDFAKHDYIIMPMRHIISWN